MPILLISLCLFTKIFFFSGLLRKTLLWSGANLAENLDMADRTDEFQQDQRALGWQPEGPGFLGVTSPPKV